MIGDAGRALGQVVATLLNVLNPEMLIVGGDLAAAGDLLLDGMRESVARAALPETSRGAQLVAGVLGERAQVLGALALVVSEADRALPDPPRTRRLARRLRFGNELTTACSSDTFRV